MQTDHAQENAAYTEARDLLVFSLTEAGIHWSRSEARKVANDLLTWFNSTEPSSDDAKALFHLYKAGLFDAHICPCGTRFFVGYPDDWGSFQGVLQADFTSYPGPWHLCDSCRCHAVD
jgi:hypothetical protein